MILMLTPVMVCGMAFCPMSAAQAAMKSEQQMPCHQSQDDSQGAPMMVMDCMGVDFFHSDVISDTSVPDQAVSLIHFVYEDLSQKSHSQFSYRNAIRGSPFGDDTVQINQSIVLTTHRIRI